MSSSLIPKIQNDLAEAQKNRADVSVSTLRYLMSALKDKEIELRPSGKELEDIDVIGVISKQVKQRRESIAEFEKGNRKDLAEKEAVELKILQGYLPEQLSEAEVSKLVDEAVAEVGAKSISDMGKVMAVLAPKIKGKVDGSVVSGLVKSRLS